MAGRSSGRPGWAGPGWPGCCGGGAVEGGLAVSGEWRAWRVDRPRRGGARGRALASVPVGSGAGCRAAAGSARLVAPGALPARAGEAYWHFRLVTAYGGDGSEGDLTKERRRRLPAVVSEDPASRRVASQPYGAGAPPQCDLRAARPRLGPSCCRTHAGGASGDGCSPRGLQCVPLRPHPDRCSLHRPPHPHGAHPSLGPDTSR